MQTTAAILAPLLAAFTSFDHDSTSTVATADLPKVLRAANVSGSVVSDVLLLLHVDTDKGVVDYSRIREELTAVSAVPQGGFKSIPQEELVFKSLPQLKKHFVAYDEGRTTLSEFRATLRDMGFVETIALQREFQKNACDLTFSQVLSALTKVVDGDQVNTSTTTTTTRTSSEGQQHASVAGKKSNSGGGRGVFDERPDEVSRQGKTRTMASSGIFSDSRAQATVPSTRGHYHPSTVFAPAPSTNTARGGVVGLSGTSFSGGRTTIGSVASTAPAVVGYSGSSFSGGATSLASPFVKKGSTRHGGENTTTSAFDVVENDAAIVRQQLHIALRKLDAGEMTVEDFKRRLRSLGIEIPESAQRLLGKHGAEASVPFKEWIKAFDPVFSRLAMAAAAATPTSTAAAAQQPSPNRPLLPLRDTKGHVHGATSHGDVLAWTEEENEEDGNVEHDGNTTGTIKSKKHMFDTARAVTTNLLHHDVTPSSPPPSPPPSQQDEQDGTSSLSSPMRVDGKKAFQDTAHVDHLPAGLVPPWSSEEHPVSAKKVIPLRTVYATSRTMPFARDGDDSIKSITGVSRSPEKRGAGSRPPFGTEVDIAEAFAPRTPKVVGQ